MNIPTEAQEQKLLFDWAGYMIHRWPELALMHHCPNGGSRNAIEAHNLRLQGVKAGIPDIFLPCARKGFHGLYIELKRRQGGKVSYPQKRMLAALAEQGYRCEICHGADEAISVIQEYMDEATM